MQIRHNPLSGGYCGEVPPLPIPNREVKLTCADGTAMQCGRVGSRLLLSRASDFERFLRLFCFHADCFFLTQMFFGSRRFRRWRRSLTCSVWDFADDADFSLMLFLFPTDFKDLHRFLTCLVLDFADFRPARSWMTQILYKNWAAQSNDGQPSLILFVFTVITRLLLWLFRFAGRSIGRRLFLAYRSWIAG